MAHSSAGICLGALGDMGVLQAPSKSGYTRVPCPRSLWAFRLSRFQAGHFPFCAFIALFRGSLPISFL